MSGRNSSFFEPVHEEVRKRVTKACDRCRLKKIKCDGKFPCSRCHSDSTLCRFGERKRTIERRIPPGYVDYLEEQQKVLVQALRKVWNERQGRRPSASSQPESSVNEILSELGILEEFTRNEPGRENFTFEEDLEATRRRMIEEEEDCITSASSARSSPGRSTIAAPVDPFKDPIIRRPGSLPQASSAPFQFQLQHTGPGPIQPSWRGGFHGRSFRNTPELPSFAYSTDTNPLPNAPFNVPQGEQDPLSTPTQAPTLFPRGPQFDDRTRISPSPFAGLTFSQQYPASPSGFSQLGLPIQPQQQQAGSQSGNTPASNPWLAEDEDTWRSFFNEQPARRE